MARPVSDTQVRALIPNTTIVSLAPFITTANILVDKLAASACGSSLSAAELEQVEIYLSAHFAAVTDPSVAITVEKVEGTSVTASRGNVNQNGILSTQYGHMANTLSSGCLVELDMRKPTVGFF